MAMYQSKQITVSVEITTRPASTWDSDLRSVAKFEMDVPVVEGEPFIPAFEWTVKEVINKLVYRTIDIDPTIAAEKDASIAKGEVAVVEDEAGPQ